MMHNFSAAPSTSTTTTAPSSCNYCCSILGTSQRHERPLQAVPSHSSRSAPYPSNFLAQAGHAPKSASSARSTSRGVDRGTDDC